MKYVPQRVAEVALQKSRQIFKLNCVNSLLCLSIFTQNNEIFVHSVCKLSRASLVKAHCVVVVAVATAPSIESDLAWVLPEATRLL